MMRASLFFLLTVLFSFEAFAAESFGLAMHGTAKYGVQNSHLDYANPDAPKGGTLRQSALGTFDTLNMFSIKGQAALGLELFYDRLTARVWDEPFTLYPLIAEKIDVPEDRSSMTVHINPAARFSDGEAITADDLVFSFETLRDQGRPNMRNVYKLVEKVEVLGPLSVRFSFGEGYNRETVMILAMMPVLAQHWWEGRDFSDTVLEAPVSSGPYRIAEVDPGRRIVFERDPEYWAKDTLTRVGHYNFDKVTYDYFRDNNVSVEAFKAGAYDMRIEYDAGRWTTAYDTVKDIVKDEIPHHRPERVNALIFNARRVPFNDQNVRKALSQALDFDWINETLLHGLYKQIDSYYPNSELAATAQNHALHNSNTIRSQLKLANDILDEQGWIIRDGQRVHKDTNEPFSFEIILTNPLDEKIALSFANNLKRLGITANIRVLDHANFMKRLGTYDYDMVVHYWQNSLSPGTEQMLYWSCQAAKQEYRWNYAGICDPEIDDLSHKIANVATREDLLDMVHSLDKKLMDGHYMIPLHFAGRDFVARRPPIKRPDTTPLYGMVVETWWYNGDDSENDR